LVFSHPGNSNELGTVVRLNVSEFQNVWL